MEKDTASTIEPVLDTNEWREEIKKHLSTSQELRKVVEQIAKVQAFCDRFDARQEALQQKIEAERKQKISAWKIVRDVAKKLAGDIDAFVK